MSILFHFQIRIQDPIFHLSVPLRTHELKTTSNKILQMPKDYAPNVRLNRRFTEKYKYKTENDDTPCLGDDPSQETFSVIKTLLNSPIAQGQTGEALQAPVISNSQSIKIDLSNVTAINAIKGPGEAKHPYRFLLLKPVHDAQLVQDVQLQVNVPDRHNHSQAQVCDNTCPGVRWTHPSMGTGGGLDPGGVKIEKDGSLQEQALDLSKTGCLNTNNTASPTSSRSSNSMSVSLDISSLGHGHFKTEVQPSLQNSDDKPCNTQLLSSAVAGVPSDSVVESLSAVQGPGHCTDDTKTGLSSNLDEEAVQSKPSVLQKKRAVPGWFGKGLTIKKKKKLYL